MGPDSLLKASEMRATQQLETVNGVAKFVSWRHDKKCVSEDGRRHHCVANSLLVMNKLISCPGCSSTFFMGAASPLYPITKNWPWSKTCCKPGKNCDLFRDHPFPILSDPHMHYPGPHTIFASDRSRGVAKQNPSHWSSNTPWTTKRIRVWPLHR